jgi:hypothetical protein
MVDEQVIRIILVAAIAAWGAWYASRAFATWWRLRGNRVVTCPETGRPAAVRIDVGHAMGSLATGDPDLHLQSCSRWAERGRCEEPCLPEAERLESAASRIVYAWAQDKACVFCGKPILEAEALGHHAALLGSDGRTREWLDIATEHLREALDTERPVCWDCHIAETFRATHPDLVTDRDPLRR